jgi:replicative DNA helicase
MSTQRSVGDSRLPQNIEAEQAVLGGLLIDARAIEVVEHFLHPKDFFLPANSEIYASILEMYAVNKVPDIVTVSNHLDNRNRLDDAGGPAYLASLALITVTSVNTEHYGRIVAEKAVHRRLVETGHLIASIGYDEGTDAQQALENAERTLFALTDSTRVEKDFVSLPTLLTSAQERLDRLHAGSTSRIGVTTGFSGLDAMTGGLRKGELIILAGRPSMGKTALALNTAQAVAFADHLPVGMFSAEMSDDDLTDRLISSKAGINSSGIRNGQMSDAEWQRVGDAMGQLGEARIFIEDTAAISLAELRSKARRLQHREGIGLLIVDYLQLMKGPGGENRVQEVSAIARGLKAVARELDVPLLALAQLSRQIDNRPNHVPMLSDLRDSGEIEQVADIVMFLHRDIVYNPETGDPRAAEVIVAKHRNGPTGQVSLSFDLPTMTFRGLSAFKSEHQGVGF